MIEGLLDGKAFMQAVAAAHAVVAGHPDRARFIDETKMFNEELHPRSHGKFASAGEMVSRAEEIARQAHAGQIDKGGQPYIHHVEAVAKTAGERGGPHAEAAGWLHDVVEDTPVTHEQLAREFPPEVTSAVKALTKEPGDDRMDQLVRAAADPIGRIVKQADSENNRQRLSALPEGPQRTRLTAKYAHDDRILTELSGVDAMGKRVAGR